MPAPRCTRTRGWGHFPGLAPPYPDGAARYRCTLAPHKTGECAFEVDGQIVHAPRQHGGARPNSGGARKGAGRPRKDDEAREAVLSIRLGRSVRDAFAIYCASVERSQSDVLTGWITRATRAR